MSVVIPNLRGAIAVPGWAKNDLWRRARAVPSLDLRFADNKSLTDAVTGASLVTFTRSTNGTYTDSAGVLQTASTNVPRFDHNPITGESLGLLVEEQRTNLLLRSEEFDTTWTPTNLTVTSNSVVAPNGTTTADTLVEDTATSTHALQQSASVVSGTTYTLSCYAKPAGRNFAQLLMLGGFAAVITAIIDITNGTVGTTAGSPTVTSVNVGNGWYRLSITATATSTTTTIVQLRPSSASSSAFYQGDGTSGIYIWGAQLEAGAFPTSYILNVNTASGVTRNADVASITGSAFSGWYRQDEGTVFTDAGVGSGNFPYAYGISDGTGNNRIILYRINAPATSSTPFDLRIDSGGSNSASFSINAATTRFGLAYKANDFAVSGNGGAAITDTSGAVPSVNQMTIGGPSFFQCNGTVSRFTFWPQRLANSTLQTLTQ